MTALLEWLLDLEGIRLGRDTPLLLQWQNPIEAWIMFAAAILAIAWVVLTVQRESTSAGRRTVVATARLGIIGLTAILLCQPAIVLQRNRIQHSYVALAVDTSASMATRETYRNTTMANNVAEAVDLDDPGNLDNKSRLELVQSALQLDANAVQQLLKHNEAQVWPFADSARLARDVPGAFESSDAPMQLVESVNALMPDGGSTNLAGALHTILESSRERRLAAVVLATDGQSTQSMRLQDVIQAAQQRRVPIYPILIGSTYAPRDLSIGSVRSRSSVFVNDIAAIQVEVGASGLTEPTDCRLKLVDTATQEVVATRTVTLKPGDNTGNESERVLTELTTKVTTPGMSKLRVVVDPLSDETVLENNSAAIDLSVLDNQLRVLYVDGYPRYEYRYLKNALVREKTVDLSVLLIEADEAFVQEGTMPIRRFPQAMDELNLYDVILFGDVDPRGGWLGDAQIEMLVEWVGVYGGGFGVIAGQRSVPGRFAGTPLEKLLPVRVADHVGGTSAPWNNTSIAEAFQPVLTDNGFDSPIFRLTLTQERDQTRFDSLPGFYWLAQTLGAKPGASVLLEHPTLRTATGLMPIVVTARYGAGKLFFQATDDTWLWRRETGEFLHDSYWVQIVRDLARGNRVAQDRRMVLRTDRRTYPYGSAVQVQAEFLDPELLRIQSDQLGITTFQTLLAKSDNELTKERFQESTDLVDRFVIHRVSEEGSLFDGTWIPPAPGNFVLAPSDIAGSSGEKGPSVAIRVERPNLETRKPEADHAILQRLAVATGGKVIDLNRMEEAFGDIEDRSMRVPDDKVESVWDSKLALVLFVLMISTEWVLRKSFGLL